VRGTDGRVWPLNSTELIDIDLRNTLGLARAEELAIRVTGLSDKSRSPPKVLSEKEEKERREEKRRERRKSRTGRGRERKNKKEIYNRKEEERGKRGAIAEGMATSYSSPTSQFHPSHGLSTFHRF